MKPFTLMLALCITGVATSQKLTPEMLKATQLKTHKQIVNQALKYNDAQTAITSMHHIMALEGDTSTYKDSLAITYFRVGNYVSSHVLAKALLVQKPKDVLLLEINAVSLQQLGATKEAIVAYEHLFAQTQNMTHGYQLANLQYSIKRLAEAQTTIAQTLQCEAVAQAYIQFPVDQTQTQNVPLKAAAYNLQGLIAFELKDNAGAGTAFNSALELMPKFTVASQNANAVVVAMQNERHTLNTTTSNN